MSDGQSETRTVPEHDVVLARACATAAAQIRRQTGKPLWQATTEEDLAVSGEDLVQETLIKVLRNRAAQDCLAAGKAGEVQAITRVSARSVANDILRRLYRTQQLRTDSLDRQADATDWEPADPHEPLAALFDEPEARCARIVAAMARITNEEQRVVLGWHLYLESIQSPAAQQNQEGVSEAQVLALHAMRTAVDALVNRSNVRPEQRAREESLQIALLMGRATPEMPAEEVEKARNWVRKRLEAARGTLLNLLSQEAIPLLPSGRRPKR